MFKIKRMSVSSKEYLSENFRIGEDFKAFNQRNDIFVCRQTIWNKS